MRKSAEQVEFQDRGISSPLSETATLPSLSMDIGTKAPTVQPQPGTKLRLCKLSQNIPPEDYSKVLMLYENELVLALQHTAPESLIPLANKAQGMLLVDMKLVYEFLDDRVPYQLRYRYLILNVYEAVTSHGMFKKWLDVLSTVNGTSGVISQMRRCYRFGTSADEWVQESDYLTFYESHIKEKLAGCTSKWIEIATSLWLPSNKIDNVIALRISPILSLKEILVSWVRCEFGTARPPTFETLREALRSDVVGLGAEANSLKREEFQRDHLSLSKEYRKATNILCTEMIVCQTPNVEVKEGNSVLLEVQVNANPKHCEWYKCDNLLKPITTNCKRNILYISANDLTSEGYYRCEMRFEGPKLWISQPISLAVCTPLDFHQQFLIDRYTAQPEIPEDSWPPVVAGTFINLALIKQKSIHRAGEYGCKTIRGDMDDIFKDKEGISYDKAVDGLSSGA